MFGDFKFGELKQLTKHSLVVILCNLVSDIQQRSAVTLHTLVRYSRGTRKVHEGAPAIVYEIVCARLRSRVRASIRVHEGSVYLTLFTYIPLLLCWKKKSL